MKMQVTKDDPLEDNMMVYNKDRDLCFHVSVKELDGPSVAGTIMKNGIGGLVGVRGKNGMPGLKESHGLKSYFLCFIEKEGEIVVITDPQLPAQPW